MSVVPIAKAVVRPVAARYVRRRVRGESSRLIVLSYHRVLPSNHPAMQYEQPGMVVSDDTFHNHLQWLSDLKLPVVSLGEWVRKAADDHAPRGTAVALTFDDGWYDNFLYAVPLLEQFQAKATIFVCPGRVESQRSFWPERLGRAVTDPDGPGLQLIHKLVPSSKRIAVMSPESFDPVVCELKSRFSDREIDDMLDQAGVPGDSTDNGRDLMTLSDLRLLAQNPLIEFGSHSDQHTRVTQLPDSDARWKEVVSSKDRLVDMLESAIDLFSYPNGDVDDIADELVRRHYRGACLTARGWNKVGDDLHALRRVGMHEDVSNTMAAFTARLGYAL